MGDKPNLNKTPLFAPGEGSGSGGPVRRTANIPMGERTMPLGSVRPQLDQRTSVSGEGGVAIPSSPSAGPSAISSKAPDPFLNWDVDTGHSAPDRVTQLPPGPASSAGEATPVAPQFNLDAEDDDPDGELSTNEKEMRAAATVPLVKTPLVRTAPPAQSPQQAKPVAMTVSNRSGFDDTGFDPQPTGSVMMPGAVISQNYHIIEELGSGGMGRVYLADDKRLERRVAIKMMREHIIRPGRESIVADRFAEEARLPARISHPNIITIFDRGIHAGIEFFVMEYIEGSRSLLHVVREQRKKREYLPLKLLKSYFLQASSGLRAIHAHEGVWHRDIKLDNLLVYELLGGGNALKLIDFGIAHNPDANLTQAGNILGTPSYVAPEYFQVENGKPVTIDYRADLFAIGIVMYACTTLRHAYQNIKSMRDAMAVYMNDENTPKLPSQHRAGLPKEWDTLLLRTIDKNRETRYKTATELHDAIETLPV